MAATATARAPTLAADLDAAWAEITTATVDVSTRTRDWSIWTAYCADNGYRNPFLQTNDPTERLQVLLWASLPDAVRAFGEGDAKSEPTQLRSRFGTSPRPTNWQDIPTHASLPADPACT